MVIFTKAGQPEILRANQKDLNIISYLQSEITNIFLKRLGTRKWLICNQWSLVVAKFVYFSVTTLSDCQTVGEEYTNIIPTDATHQQLPKKFVRLVYISLDSFGDLFIMSLLKHLENNVSNLKCENKSDILSYINTLKTSIALIQKFHKAVFYMNGSFYHVSRRLMGINYILLQYWKKNEGALSSFKFVGTVFFMYLTFLTVHDVSKWWHMKSIHTKSINPSRTFGNVNKTISHSQCFLCLKDICNSCVTPCGHLFCWTCLLEWLQVNPICPYCRETIQESRVVMLQNLTAC